MEIQATGENLMKNCIPHYQFFSPGPRPLDPLKSKGKPVDKMILHITPEENLYPCILPCQEYIIFPQQLYLKSPSRPSNYTLAVLDFITLYYRQIFCQGRWKYYAYISINYTSRFAASR